MPAVPGAASGATGAVGAGSAEGGAPGTAAANAAVLGLGSAHSSASAKPSGRPSGPRRSPLCPCLSCPGPGPGSRSSQDTMPEGEGGDCREVPALVPDGEPLREEVLGASSGNGARAVER